MKVNRWARKRIILKPLQLDALLHAAIRAKRAGYLDTPVEIQQTYTRTGGRHTYVEIAGEQYHVAANGKMQRLGIVEAKGQK
jgi:hypothetical protein